MTTRPTNWAGNLTFRARQIHRPTSYAQLQGLVAAGTKVRALGSGHSFSDIADTPGDLVCTAGLPAEMEIDAAAGTARVGASIRYTDLGPYLHGKGYGLRNLASLPHISVAGSVATATHGSGDGNGNLATAVSALTLVTADGDLIDISGDALKGAVVALGALGVVVGVTLDLVPAFEVSQYVYEGLPLDDDLDARLEEIWSAAYSVSLFTSWRGPVIDQVWLKHLGTAEPRDFGAALADGPRHPVPGMPAGNCTEQGGRPGPWFERLPHFRPDFTPSSGEELQSEYFVPRRHAVAALRVLDGLRDQIAPVLQVSEIRTVAADELWLSPCYRQDSVAFHFTWVKDTRQVMALLPLIEEALAPFEVRPHWGKLFVASPAARYERMNDFRELALSHDPTGKFGNDFLARNLG